MIGLRAILSLATVAIGASNCGLAPRLDYHEGASVSHSYAMDYRALSTCVFERLDRVKGVRKADFPERQAARISKDTGDSILRLFQLDFSAEGQNRTLVTVPIPMNHTGLHPDSLFPEVDACAQRL